MSTPPPPPHPSLMPEIGPDGLARDSPVIAYTEKVIAAEQQQLKKYIQENYSKIRDVERELENLNLELKLTAGPKKAALEHLRKKIELSTERIRAAKLKEEQAKKAWEDASKAVQDEEAAKQKLCDDLNRLVQESAATQYSRLEELKKRLESLNPGRASTDVGAQQAQPQTVSSQSAEHIQTNLTANSSDPKTTASSSPGETMSGPSQRQPETKEKRRPPNAGRSRSGVIIMPRGRGTSPTGWTGAGFDVDGGT